MAKPRGMRGGGLHPQEKKIRSVWTNPALPSPPFLRQGSQAWCAHRDPTLVWHPQDLLPALGELPRLGTEEQQHTALLPALRELWQGTV